MNINKEISDFLRDSQYKLALMTIEMDKLEDQGDVFYTQLKMQRWELDYFYSILYDTIQSIEGGYNWLLTASWTNKDILNEIHYLRRKYKLNGLPVLSYASTINTIVNYVTQSIGVPGGNVPNPIAVNDLLLGGLNGWELGTLSEYGGMLDDETLVTYFTGRL